MNAHLGSAVTRESLSYVLSYSLRTDFGCDKRAVEEMSSIMGIEARTVKGVLWKNNLLGLLPYQRILRESPTLRQAQIHLADLRVMDAQVQHLIERLGRAYEATRNTTARRGAAE